ncbi:MAG: twin-arginine translocase TatA/TatE family subunit, partial [Thermoleophilia bacterium]|nr:twin-arginine translocase TatA/TatE family subunit [Thermoleophilia bacterium]
MLGLSPVQILIVLAIVLLLFGARRLPDMARGLGRSLREFRGGLTGAGERDESAAQASPPREAVAG